MTYTASPPPADSIDQAPVAAPDAALEGWQDVRDDSDIQFEPVDLPEPEPREPSAFEEALKAIFEFLGDLLSPIGGFLANSWPVLKWVILAAVVAFVAYALLNTIGPLARKKREARANRSATGEPEWTPTQSESLALLEDADRLAAEGKFDEATHLLLRRSVSQIATARPDWVEPSSTARELAALPALSDGARGAFGVIAERVERSLFALRALDKGDWEAARAAYADFAQIRIGGAK